VTLAEPSTNGNGHVVAKAERARALWDEANGQVSDDELARAVDASARSVRRWRGHWTAEVAKPVAKKTASPVAKQTVRRTRRWPKHWRPVVKRVATAVALAVGLAVSYSHIVHLAVLAGAGWWAWVMPLPLDVMALVSLLHLAEERWYPVAWAGVLVGAAGSLTANVLAVDPSLVELRYVLWGFAALPPIAVVICGHLLDRGAR
jgi:hypothetical protein